MGNCVDLLKAFTPFCKITTGRFTLEPSVFPLAVVQLFKLVVRKDAKETFFLKSREHYLGREKVKMELRKILNIF